MRDWFRISSGKLFIVLVAAGVFLRVVTTIIAGNGIFTPWRVGGDAPFYVRLASNIASGFGYAYFGGPTAFRPPVYPLLLAGLIRIFGQSAFFGMRVAQLCVGVATAWLCARMCSRIFDEERGRLALVIALFLPTLLIFPTELMTECLATFLVAMFFDCLLLNPALTRRSTAVLLGLTVGLSTLLRFNMAALGFVALFALGKGMDWPLAGRRMLLMTAVATLVVAPWLVRNLIVFHGRVLLSTQGGMNAVQGVLTPQGRVQGNDVTLLHDALGWQAGDLESNSPPVLPIPAEPELDRRAWVVASRLWGNESWRLIPLSLSKLGYFWLSTDQLFWTRSFSREQRVVRSSGVIVHWIVLAFAVVGWRRLSRAHRDEAKLLLAYAVLISLLHLPFIMSSRYRIPFLDPVLVVLFAGSMAAGSVALVHPIEARRFC
jgi:4-amino-4-deoxy-L-arabinose transferase-like glycosyltransferase